MGISVGSSGGGSGIAGSTGATDNALLRADGAGGATAQSSTIIVDDTGYMTGVLRPITASTIDAAVAVTQSGTIFTNTGASGEVILTISASATVGGYWTFIVTTDAQYLRVKVAALRTIRNGTTGVTAAGGYIRSNAIGSWLTVQQVTSTLYYVVSIGGTWTIDS